MMLRWFHGWKKSYSPYVVSKGVELRPTDLAYVHKIGLGEQPTRTTLPSSDPE